jgi:DNA helicase-2/ATP-dependent DNA helicase PcrA
MAGWLRGGAMTSADERIRACIEGMQSFVLDAGAGAGKTFSLVEALRHLLSSDRGVELSRSSQRVACITFTNVAKDEIIERTARNPLLHVSTIHEFLWAVIKPHQKALKRALLRHNEQLGMESKRKRDPAELEAALATVTVSYSDRGAEFLEGRIHHDDLLAVARLVFADNRLMAKVAAARYPFIFVDEYQDTSEAVVAVLLDEILATNEGRVLIGFFGDKFQNIYHGGEHPGIGEISAERQKRLQLIPKEENYRCSEAVIAVLNRIRTDIKQFPAGKNKNVRGGAVYIRFANAADQADAFARAREVVRGKLGWDPETGTQKELFLTHRLIARKAGYEGLLQVYQRRGGFSRDQLLNGEDPIISFFRERTEPLIAAWSELKAGRVLSLLRAGGFRLDDSQGKALAKAGLDKLRELQAAGSVGDVLAQLAQARLLELPDELAEALKAGEVDPKGLDDDEAADRAFYAELLATPYAEISAICQFLDEHSPFSTKHGVKGAEFDTVFVLLDDKGARWNIYSFDKYLSGEDAKANSGRMHRTRNLFYVCCSRAKKNLAVVDLGSSSAAKDARINELFGAENVLLA